VVAIRAYAAAIVNIKVSWEAPVTERTMPEGVSDERSLLDGWLDYYRATLLAKCDGLYLIKEYARHLGHADLLRERLDGVTGE
jgi:hypothetical protein